MTAAAGNVTKLGPVKSATSATLDTVNELETGEK